MAIVTLFKNRFGPVNVSTPKGEVLKFAAGRYFTQNKAHEKYLQQLADNNESGVYVDPNEKTVDTENLDPMAAIKAKIRAEIEADIKAGKHNVAAPVTPGNTEVQNLQQSTQNTMGAATAKGTPVTKSQETVQVAGDGTQADAPQAPSKLEQLKQGNKKEAN